MIDRLTELWKSRHPYDALFLELIDGYEIKVLEEYPNSIFYIKSDDILIKYNKKTKYAYINAWLIWEVFESKYYLNYNKFSELMIDMLETHLKLKEIIPYKEYYNMLFRFYKE